MDSLRDIVASVQIAFRNWKDGNNASCGPVARSLWFAFTGTTGSRHTPKLLTKEAVTQITAPPAADKVRLIMLDVNGTWDVHHVMTFVMDCHGEVNTAQAYYPLIRTAETWSLPLAQFKGALFKLASAKNWDDNYKSSFDMLARVSSARRLEGGVLLASRQPVNGAMNIGNAWLASRASARVSAPRVTYICADLPLPLEAHKVNVADM